MKLSVFNRSGYHNIQYEDWPVDCLLRYLEKKQKMLLSSMAPAILSGIRTLNTNKSGESAWFRQLDDLFTSSINRLVIQIARQNQYLLPCANHLTVATERELPLNTHLVSVVYDAMDYLRQDLAIQKRIFELIRSTLKDSRSDHRPAFNARLFSSIQLFETELFTILELQRKVLYPKIFRMASRL